MQGTDCGRALDKLIEKGLVKRRPDGKLKIAKPAATAGDSTPQIA